jgi:fermentation-respiration switch protein FrsA (DUF1100 family)
MFLYDSLIAAARRITVPVELLLPWDDEVLDRENGLALFDAFASEEKTLHAFPGGHHQVPGYVSQDSSFFVRHLGGTYT